MEKAMKFDATHVAYALALCAELASCKQHGGWFRAIKQSNVSVTTMDSEDDSLDILDCSIQMIEQDVRTIAGSRKAPAFAVLIPVTSPGTYWEPPDTDMAHVATCNSLAEAIGQLYLYEAQRYVQDSVMALCYRETAEEVL